VGRSLRSVLRRCLELQRAAIQSFAPHAIVGSSWGGALLFYSICFGWWRGPSLLLAPAQCKVQKYAQLSAFPHPLQLLDVSDKRSPKPVPPFPLHIIHGTRDLTIPIQHSEQVFGVPFPFPAPSHLLQ
jgi:hypothetical protein